MKYESIKVSELVEYGNNAKIHTDEQIQQIMLSIEKFGFNDPIGIDENNMILEGHGRFLACKRLGYKEIPCFRITHLKEEDKPAYILAHNKINLNTGFDDEILFEELELIDNEIDMSLFGFDVDVNDVLNDENDKEIIEPEAGSLVRDFGIVPVNIFDTRQGYWNDRKRKWRDKIKDYGESRDHVDVLPESDGSFASVSLLDPVLAEIITRWFTPTIENAKVFDTFAGDTVFGYVSSYLGNTFTGIELREEQARLNNERVKEVNKNSHYFNDDALNVLKHIPEKSQDLYFSCPPYYDLEVYSDLENDASNQGTYEEFYSILHRAFLDAMKCLKDDRFAVVVAGDVRNKKDGGSYYGFIDDIKATMKEAGLHFYNDIILINAYGTAGMRARNAMKNRKMINVKQNVLVFYKGDIKKIKENFGEIKVNESEDI